MLGDVVVCDWRGLVVDVVVVVAGLLALLANIPPPVVVGSKDSLNKNIYLVAEQHFP